MYFFPLAFLAEALCQQTHSTDTLTPPNSPHLPNSMPGKTRCCGGHASITRRDHCPGTAIGSQRHRQKSAAGLAAKQGYPWAALGDAFPLHLLLLYKSAIYEKYKPAFPSLQPKRSYQVSGEISSSNRLFGGCLQYFFF